MKYLDKILEANGIKEGFRAEAEKEYLEAKERMAQLPISFSEDAELMLSNHLMALIKRISEKQFIEPIGEEIMGEISEAAWKYANGVAGPLFTKNGVDVNRSEIFLVGTHMEMAIASAVVV